MFHNQSANIFLKLDGNFAQFLFQFVVVRAATAETGRREGYSMYFHLLRVPAAWWWLSASGGNFSGSNEGFY